MGNGNILIPLQRLEDIETNLKDIAIPLLKDDWTEDNGVYKQTVLVDGLKADWTPNIMLSSVGAEATDDELNAFACLDEYNVEDGSITFVASEIPSISFTVIAKGVMTSDSQTISDVTALVSKVNELETEIDELNSELEDSGWVLLSGAYSLYARKVGQMVTITLQSRNIPVDTVLGELPQEWGMPGYMVLLPDFQALGAWLQINNGSRVIRQLGGTDARGVWTFML
jgi:hypothetical protein